MGFKGDIISLFISGFIMALIWQISEMGFARSITDNFGGKIIFCVFAIIIAKVLGIFLSGGK